MHLCQQLDTLFFYIISLNLDIALSLLNKIELLLKLQNLLRVTIVSFLYGLKHIFILLVEPQECNLILEIVKLKGEVSV